MANEFIARKGLIALSDSQITGSLTVTGTVDGVDIATLKSDFDTLEGKTLVSGSSQISLGSATGTVDISSQTNLAGGTNLTLSGDTMNLDANISLTNVTASIVSASYYYGTSLVGANEYAFRYTNGGTIFDTGLFFSQTNGQFEFLNGSATPIFSIKAGSGNTTISGNVTASSDVDIQGVLSLPGFPNVSSSLAAAVAGGDNLGNHTATQNLNMGGYSITNINQVDGIDVSTLSSNVQGNSLSIVALNAATSSYVLSVNSEPPDGSGDVSLTTSEIGEGSNQYYTDARVKTKLNADNVVSGSATQVRSFLNVADGATANTGTVTSVGGNGTVDGLTLSGTVTTTGNLTLGGAISITTSSITDFPTEVSRSAAAAGFGGGGGTGTVDTSGTPASTQVAVFTDADTIQGTNKLIFANSALEVASSNSDTATIKIYGGVVGAAQPYISPTGGHTNLRFGDAATNRTFDFQNNKIAFDQDTTNTYIMADTDTPENLEIHADGNIELRADDNLQIFSNIDVNSFAISNVTSITGSDSAAIELNSYPIGYEAVSAFPITGSGLIIRETGLPANNYPMLKIGDVELIDINSTLSPNVFFIHNVDSFLVASGSEPVNIFGDGPNKLFEHDGDAFKVYTKGIDIAKLTVESGSVSISSADLSVAGKLYNVASEATINYIAGYTATPSPSPTYELSVQSVSSVLSGLNEFSASAKISIDSINAATSSFGGSSSPVFITSLGGRLQIGTAQDAGEDNMVLAGGLGAHYYVWSTEAFLSSNAVSSGIGTPGTSTFSSGTGYNIINGLFRVLANGTATIAGTIEFDSNSEVQNQTMRFFVWKLDSSEVSALDNGTYDSSWSGTLVASTSVTVPGSSQNITPMRFKSTNGTSVSADDMIFATAVFDGTVTGTRYFPVNYQLYTT